jgi:hypothetical protein
VVFEEISSASDGRVGSYDDGMTSTQRTARPRAGLWRVLSALAVLAGVLAMHGLSPSGVPAAGEHMTMTSLIGMPVGHVGPAHHPHGGSRHLAAVGDAEGGGMVMDHAGGTCAAGGISVAYSPPALTAALSHCGATHALLPTGWTQTGAYDGRAPPDLAQLQLLRI